MKVRTLSGGKLPPGIRPSYAVKAGYFIYASSPEQIAKFNPPTIAIGTETESPLVRISGSGLRDYLTKHADPIATAFAVGQGRALKEVKVDLSNVIESLETIEKLELSAIQENGVTRLSLVLTPTKSLKK